MPLRKELRLTPRQPLVNVPNPSPTRSLVGVSWAGREPSTEKECRPEAELPNRNCRA